MLVKGIARGDLEAAVEIASGTLGNRLELYAMYPANRRGSAWRFRVKVADPDAPGARRYFRRYGLRLTKAPKRSHNPCTHALERFSYRVCPWHRIPAMREVAACVLGT